MLLAAVAVLVVVVGAALAFTVFGGDDGAKKGENAAPPATTTTTEAAPACASSSGRCVVIDEITEEDGGLVVAYTTVGYQPRIEGSGTDRFHVHFFYDTVPVENAGVPGRGPWIVWDLDPDGRFLLHDVPAVQRDQIPSRATQLCAVVGTHDHRLDEDPKPSCKDLP